MRGIFSAVRDTSSDPTGELFGAQSLIFFPPERAKDLTTRLAMEYGGGSGDRGQDNVERLTKTLPKGSIVLKHVIEIGKTSAKGRQSRAGESVVSDEQIEKEISPEGAAADDVERLAEELLGERVDIAASSSSEAKKGDGSGRQKETLTKGRGKSDEAKKGEGSAGQKESLMKGRRRGNEEKRPTTTKTPSFDEGSAAKPPLRTEGEQKEEKTRSRLPPSWFAPATASASSHSTAEPSRKKRR